MAFIGNTVQTQGFAPAIDYFSGNGSTVTFTLSRPVASVAQMIVVIANVPQNPSSAYTVSGNAITFTSAPPSGTNNIWVEYTSLITTYAAISQSPSVIGDITASGGYLAVGSFGNSFIDGTIVDYVTGNGRVTVGPADGFTIYNGGTSARNALMTLDSSGYMGIGNTSPTQRLDVSGWMVSRGDSSSSAFTNPGQVALKAAADNPYISWHGNSGTRLGYLQIQAATCNLMVEANQPLNIGTNNLARIVIDTSGRVTMPYQPYAYVTPPAGFSITSGADTTVNGTWGAITNTGNCFNTSGGIFTAPVAGVYQITWSWFANNTSGSRVDAYILVNGSIKARTEQNKWATNASNNVANITISLLLAANDAITFGAYSNVNTSTYTSTLPWQFATVRLLG